MASLRAGSPDQWRPARDGACWCDVRSAGCYRARRRRKAHEDTPQFVPYASHHLAMLMGRKLLADMGIELDNFSNQHFGEARATFERGVDRYYEFAVEGIDKDLRDCYGDRPVSLPELAGTFRRGDLMEMLKPAARVS